MDFGWFLEDFWMIFQWFFIEFWLIFDVSTAAPTARHSAREYLSKFIEKSSKNQSKINQKSIKNCPKSRSGELRGRFGGLLGRLGRSKGFLKASWIVLEASWKRLGRKKWPTWRQLGLKLAPKTEAKSPGAVLQTSWEPLGGLMYPILCIFDAFELHALENMHLRQILYEFSPKKWFTEVT